MWCLATPALCQLRCPLAFRSGTQTCSWFRLEDTTAPVAGPAGRDSLVCLLTNLARGPHHTDPEPWHGAGSPSRDSLSLPVTHSCPATHSFHPYSFPLLLHSQMGFQELSGQLVSIPMLIPSGFWECSLCLLTADNALERPSLRAPLEHRTFLATLPYVAFAEGDSQRTVCKRQGGTGARSSI